MSPFCYYPIGNITPTGLTPTTTLLSPHGFYINSFTHSMIHFQHVLN